MNKKIIAVQTRPQIATPDAWGVKSVSRFQQLEQVCFHVLTVKTTLEYKVCFHVLTVKTTLEYKVCFHVFTVKTTLE